METDREAHDADVTSKVVGLPLGGYSMMPSDGDVGGVDVGGRVTRGTETTHTHMRAHARTVVPAAAAAGGATRSSRLSA
jgi:hypothetical protein